MVPLNSMRKSSEQPAPEMAGLFHDRPAEVPDLELPDGGGFRSRRTPVSLEHALALIDERRNLFPSTGATKARQLRNRVIAEFVL